MPVTCSSSHNLTKSGFLYKWQLMPLCCKHPFKSGPCHLRKTTCISIIIWSLLVNCSRSVVFSGYSTNKTDRHDITEILLKVVLKHHNRTPTHPEIRQLCPIFWMTNIKICQCHTCISFIYLVILYRWKTICM